MSGTARSDRELFAYDGTTFIGRMVVTEDNVTDAFDTDGKALGQFPNYRAAFRAISAHWDALSPNRHQQWDAA